MVNTLLFDANEKLTLLLPLGFRLRGVLLVGKRAGSFSGNEACKALKQLL